MFLIENFFEIIKKSFLRGIERSVGVIIKAEAKKKISENFFVNVELQNEIAELINRKTLKRSTFKIAFLFEEGDYRLRTIFFHWLEKIDQYTDFAFVVSRPAIEAHLSEALLFGEKTVP